MALSEIPQAEAVDAVPDGPVQGGRLRGLVLHKLIEEILTGETDEKKDALESRARKLLEQLGSVEAASAEEGPYAPELAATVLRALSIPEVAAIKSRLMPEMTILSAETAGDEVTYLGGVADALALDGNGAPEVVIDWKSDVQPDAAQIDVYRGQVRDYMMGTGAKEGLLIFISTGRVEKVGRS
jgi:exodeoxyribonuclease-5